MRKYRSSFLNQVDDCETSFTLPMSCLHTLRRSTCALVALAASSATAVCTGVVPAIVAPPPGSTVPANAPVFVAPRSSFTLEVARGDASVSSEYPILLERHRDGDV